MLFAEFQRFVLQWGCECVVPTIEEAKHRNDAYDFDDLIVTPVLAQIHEHLVGHRIRHAARRNGDIKRRSLCRSKQRAGLIIPNRIEFLLVYPKLRSTFCSMCHAISTSGRATGDM